MKHFKILMALMCLLVGSMSYAQNFVDMPPLNQSEAKMLKMGILTYVQSYPDSVSSSIYDNLKEISLFTDNPDSTLTKVFHNIPVKVINFIELQYYNGDIIKWSVENDNDNMMLKSDKNMMEYQVWRIKESELKLKNKETFRCKYFILLGYPCPEN